MNKREMSLFKPTPLYKELITLSIISSGNLDNTPITQRMIAKEANVSPTMVNEYLADYEKQGYIKIVRENNKMLDYKITKIGEERRKLLSIFFLESSLDVYNEAKVEVIKFMNQIASKGYKNILFYGSGEVAEIIMYVINNSIIKDLNVLAIIDDNPKLIGEKITNVDIISINDINKYDYDGILISSYTNNDIIKDKLLNIVDKDKIIEFFK